MPRQHLDPARKVAFRWTEQKEKAALLVGQGKLTYPKIAEELGIDRSTLIQWRAKPEFMARVDEHIAEFKAEVMRLGIANRANRIAAQNERWEAMRQLVSERAADDSMKDVPGGKTGLIVRRYRTVGQGPAAEVVEEYIADTPLLKEFREVEKLASEECGQRRILTDDENLVNKTDAELESIARGKSGS